MNDRSIEFQEIKDYTSLPEIVRKSFRVPVEDKEKVWVVIDKQRYPVLDICLDGIGIALEKNAAFTIEQAVLNCELNVFDTSIKALNGQIVHLTTSKGENWQCGIQWINMEKEASEKILKIVSKMKDQLLNDESRSSDSK